MPEEAVMYGVKVLLAKPGIDVNQADKDGVTTGDEALAFAGRPLDDASTVAECGLGAGSTLQHVGAYWQGEGTLRVPMTLHLKNRTRLLDQFAAPDVPANSYIVLQGGAPSPARRTGPHLTRAARAVMNDGASLVDVLPELTTLTAMTLGFGLLGSWLFRWE